MKRRTLLQTLPAASLLPATVLAAAHSRVLADPSAETAFELRVYHCYEGKLPDLLKRFRDHTTKLFGKARDQEHRLLDSHGRSAKSNTLIYIIAHPSREAAAANWKAFQADPEWISVRDKSEANGKIVEKVDSTYMTKTDFSNFGL